MDDDNHKVGPALSESTGYYGNEDPLISSGGGEGSILFFNCYACKSSSRRRKKRGGYVLARSLDKKLKRLNASTPTLIFSPKSAGNYQIAGQRLIIM